MKQRIPAFLKPGDLIGLSATARFATQEMIDTAVEFIEKAGFNVHFEKDILFQEGQVAGSIAQRIQSFNKLIHHDGIKAIWNIRGGYGS
ncbi:MAG: LD-carboxypeptidase, partial [Schleiferiaceae bacterium]